MDKKNIIIIRADPDLKDLIPGYLENRRKDIQKITEAVARGDFETARILGHSMKGSGGGYGFDRVSEIGAEIEQKAKMCDGQGIAAAVAPLDTYLQQIEVVYE